MLSLFYFIKSWKNAKNCQKKVGKMQKIAKKRLEKCKKYKVIYASLYKDIDNIILIIIFDKLM